MPQSPSTPGIPLAELALKSGARLDGDGGVRIHRVATLENASSGSIAFLSNPRYRSLLATTGASAVIVGPDDAAETSRPKLVAANPYAAYAKVAALLHPEDAQKAGVHPTALIDPGARIAASASVGPGAIVGAGASIGERCVVGPLCVVGADVSLAEDVVLKARVTLYPRCVLGPRTLVHSGAVLGADGFGMAEEGGRWLKIPQVGRVVIGADVEIGANTTIDRGAIGDTIIEDDVKLDNLIQIGHNCVIGSHTAIAGCAGIAGSTRIGRNCKIGGAAMIAGHIEIAEGTIISGGTGVYGSIKERGIYTSAFPALPHRKWQHVASQVRRLRELADQVDALERAVKALQDAR